MRTLIALLCALPLGAADYYISTTGSAANPGTRAAPWSISKVVNSTRASVNTAAQAGDTIFIRGGTYTIPGTATSYCTLTGASGNPITIKPYPGEQYTIKGDAASVGNILLTGSYVDWHGGVLWWAGKKVSESGGSNPPDALGATLGVQGDLVNGGIAQGNRIINWLAYDGGGFVSATSSDVDTTYYGNTLLTMGWDAPDRLHGGPAYTQNNTGTETHKHNAFVGNGYWYGWRAKTTSGTLNNIALIENVFDVMAQYYKEGATTTISGMTLRGNLFGGGMSFFGISTSTGITIDRNYINQASEAGNGMALPGTATDPAVTDNTFVCNFSTGCIAHFPVFSGAPTYTGNNYYPAHNYCFNGATTGLISVAAFASSWQSLGRDTTGSCTHISVGGGPASNWVTVWPNEFESGKALIGVYNWEGLTAQAVNVASVLADGDPYELIDAYNPQVVLASGTISNHTLTLPLTGLATYTPSVDIGTGRCWRTSCSDCYTAMKSAASAAALPTGATLYEPGIITGTNALYYWSGTAWISTGAACAVHDGPSFSRPDAKLFAFQVRRPWSGGESVVGMPGATGSATIAIEYGHLLGDGTISWESRQETSPCAAGALCSVAIRQRKGSTYYRFRWLDAGGSVVSGPTQPFKAQAS